MVVQLIVPDVHEKIHKLQRILQRYSDVPKVIFQGDWLDSWDGFTEETTLTVEWLRNNIGDPRYEFQWGNHDLSYAFPIKGVICSGFDPHKLHLVRNRLTHPDHWSKFKLLSWVGKPGTQALIEPAEWLCSHAGIHPSLLHPFKGFDRATLEEMGEDAIWRLRYCQEVAPLIAVGTARGGSAPVGGIDWLDWDTEFSPIPGLNQIVGHTCGRKVRTNHTAGSANYCIDTDLNDVVLIHEDGQLTIEHLEV